MLFVAKSYIIKYLCQPTILYYYVYIIGYLLGAKLLNAFTRVRVYIRMILLQLSIQSI